MMYACGILVTVQRKESMWHMEVKRFAKKRPLVKKYDCSPVHKVK